MKNNKQIIFISHIHEEKEIAEYISDLLSKKETIKCYLSSEDKDREEILKDLSCSDAGIILCSQKSVNDSLINYEAGALWAKGVPIILVYHSDIALEDISDPLKSLNATCLELKSNSENKYIIDIQKIYSILEKNMEI